MKFKVLVLMLTIVSVLTSKAQLFCHESLTYPLQAHQNLKIDKFKHNYTVGEPGLEKQLKEGYTLTLIPSGPSMPFFMGSIPSSISREVIFGFPNKSVIESGSMPYHATNYKKQFRNVKITDVTWNKKNNSGQIKMLHQIFSYDLRGGTLEQYLSFEINSPYQILLGFTLAENGSAIVVQSVKILKLKDGTIQEANLQLDAGFRIDLN